MPSNDALAKPHPSDFSLLHGALLACVGAFFDAFTFIEKGRVFANAMTANVVLLGVNAGKADWRQCFNHFLPIVAFTLAIITAATLNRIRTRHPLYRPASMCVLIEIFFLLVAGGLPEGLPDYYFTLSISYMATLQNTIFTNIEKQTINTVMMTGNLRKLLGTLAEILFMPLRPDQKDAVRVFGTVSISFLLGALIGGILSPILHNHALWVPCVLLAVVTVSLLKHGSGAESRQGGGIS
jgi:uncharacterized membrane protein YoaK (UPF0700 family)